MAFHSLADLEELRRSICKRMIKKSGIKIKDIASGIHIPYTSLSKKLNGNLPFSETDLNDILLLMGIQFDPSPLAVVEMKNRMKALTEAVEIKDKAKVNRLLHQTGYLKGGSLPKIVSYAMPYPLVYELCGCWQNRSLRQAESCIEDLLSCLFILEPDEQAFILDLIVFFYFSFGSADQASGFYQEALRKSDSHYLPGYVDIIQYHLLSCKNSSFSKYESLLQCRKLHLLFGSRHNLPRMLDVAVLEVEYLLQMEAYEDCEKIGANLLKQMDDLKFTDSSRLSLLHHLILARMGAGRFEAALEMMADPFLTHENSGNILCFRVFCFYQLGEFERALQEIPQCLSSISDKNLEEFFLLAEDLILKRKAGFAKRLERVKKKTDCFEFSEVSKWICQLAADYCAQNQDFKMAFHILRTGSYTGIIEEARK